eukprot:502571_1
MQRIMSAKAVQQLTNQKPIFSKQFIDVCYKHLLLGQCKHQSFMNWLNTHQIKTCNISIKDKIFTLNPENNKSIHLPLQLIGSYNKTSNHFKFSYNDPSDISSEINKIKTQFPEIPEFQNEYITNCSNELGYIMSSIITSMLNMDGYYVSTKDDSIMTYILLNELSEYTNYEYKEFEGINLNFEQLYNCWDYTFKHLVTKSNLELTDNVKIFNNLFRQCNIQYDIKKDKLTGHSTIEFETNFLDVSTMHFDDKNEFYYYQMLCHWPGMDKIWGEGVDDDYE